ncbi:MAG: DegT/DnrJ/EryC1/StrS family aminotransferase [Planktothrix sp.]|uniref:DegT/DnrJ/EryC1/StrS family aminotransferase n=1 Tax=Planktothrix sp. TaxID=3088171 RepID=UPI0038D488B8
MTSTLSSVPFVDLTLIHDPLKPEIQAAIQAVMDQSDFVLGHALTDFEIAFANACGVQYGVGVACGTDAIALGLQACGIQPGDEVLVPANTFIATLIGVLHAGATPVLVDCDPHTALIDLNQADKAVTKKTKAIIPVHLYGQMVSPHQLFAFAKAHDLIIFEDAAQAHLAERESYGAGSIGLAAAFSFYPSKNLGAFGDGGMVVTQNETVAANLRSLRNYGAPQKYVHTERGTNSRLDTLQAAILKVKLPHLEQWNRERNFAAEKYDASVLLMREKGIIPIENQSADGHVYHLYVIRVTEDCAITRDRLKDQLSEQGIQVGIHYPIPCHLQPAYQNLGYKEGDFPQAEKLSQQILSLPMYPGLTTHQINQVISAIQSTIN